MGRKKRWPIRKTLTMDEALQARIAEYWRKHLAEHDDELSVIRHLLDEALASNGVA